MSWVTAAGIEECRKACGGHGYSRFSGLVDQFSDYVPATTYEGDNWIIVQQCTRYLVKWAKRAAEGKADGMPSGLSYLRDVARPVATAADGCAWTTGDCVRALEERARWLVLQTAQALGRALGEGMPFAAAWDSCKVVGVRAARAHAELTVARTFHAEAEAVKEVCVCVRACVRGSVCVRA